MTIEQMYEETIKPLPASERLRLATLILNDISPLAVVDYNDEWAEQDQEDFSRASWEHINRRIEEAERA